MQRKPLQVKSPLKATKSLQSKSGLTAKKQLVSKAVIKASSKPTKKPSLPTISKLKKEADKWHSLAVRLRFAENVNGEWVVGCVTCTHQPPKLLKKMQCGHCFSRQYNSTRYDDRNTAPQDYGCNVMQQGKQYEFCKWIDSQYGDGTADELYRLSRVPKQFTREELLQIIEDRKAEVLSYGYED